jgi:hypothetical protein
MTTANEILTASVPNVLSIPLEAVVGDAGYQYAFKKNGSRVVKQMIETGTMNDNEIIVRRGLTRDDLVLLTPPADQAGISTERIAGLKPATNPASADAAKGVTIPAKKPGPVTSAPAPASAPAAKTRA